MAIGRDFLISIYVAFKGEHHLVEVNEKDNIDKLKDRIATFLKLSKEEIHLTLPKMTDNFLSRTLSELSVNGSTEIKVSYRRPIQTTSAVIQRGITAAASLPPVAPALVAPVPAAPALMAPVFSPTLLATAPAVPPSNDGATRAATPARRRYSL